MGKQIIMERTDSFAKTISGEPFDKLLGVDEGVGGKSGFAIDNGGARARLRMLVEHQRRARPGLSETDAVAAGWRGLSYKDRNALLHESDDGEDVTFDRHDTATVARRLFATNLIGKHAEEIRKAEPALSEAQSRIEARRRFPDIAARERA